MKFISGLVFAMMAVGVASPAIAQHTDLSIENPWSRATPPSAKTGAAFLTISNRGVSADRLLSAASDAADAVELHTHLREGNIMRMRKVDNIPVPAGKSTMLAPGGLHVMLIGLRSPLKQGGQIDLILTFEKAGRVVVKAPILGVGALGPGGAAGHGMPRH